HFLFAPPACLGHPSQPCRSANRSPIERAELLLDPASEGPHLRAITAATGADEVIRSARGWHERDRDDQVASAQAVVREQVVCEQDAGALTRGVEGVIGAVEAQPAGYVDALDAPRSEPVGPRRHRGTAGERTLMNEGRPGEGLRGPHGSVAFDYSGAAYRYERQLDELLNHQRRIGAWLDRQITHRDVDAIGCEIGVIDRGGDADVDVGVAAGEPV